MKITRRELRNLICEALDKETADNLNEAFFVGHTVLNSGEMSLGRVFSESDDEWSGKDSRASYDEVIAGLLENAPRLYRAFIADGNPNQIQDLESQAGLTGMDFLTDDKKLKKVYDLFKAKFDIASAGLETDRDNKYNNKLVNGPIDVWLEYASEFVDPEQHEEDSVAWEHGGSYNNDSSVEVNKPKPTGSRPKYGLGGTHERWN